MNKQLTWMVVTALVFGVVGCKKNEAGADVPSELPAAHQVGNDEGEVAKAPVVVRLSPGERAKMHGFSKYLPQDSELVFSLHNGSNAAGKIMVSKMWSAVTGQESEVLAELGEGAVDELDIGPAAWFGHEFTVALGDQSGEQLGNMLKLGRRVNFHRMRELVKAYSKLLAEGETKPLMRMFGQVTEVAMKSMLSEEDIPGQQSAMALIEDLQMPPMYLAFKASDETREAMAQQVASTMQMMTMMGGMVEPVEEQRGEAVFSGYKLAGAMFAEMMKKNREEMEKEFPAETVERLIQAVEAKNLVLMSGVLDEYVVLFIGPSVDDLVITGDVQESILAQSDFAFADAYHEKELLAVWYGEEAGMRDIVGDGAGGLGEMAAGLREGLSASDQFGDTRSLEALLRMVEERESELYALASSEGSCGLGFFEDGFKIESYWGYDSGRVDWEVSNQLASLAEFEDVFLFANVTTDVIYDAKARAYIEALMETLYAGAMKFAELPNLGQSLLDFKNGAHLFDTKVRPDLLSLWDAYRGDFSDSLGRERAWVADLKGSVPPIGIESSVAKDAKFVRLAMVAPVVDRAKLKNSWEKMSVSINGLVATASELKGMKIPMGEPMSSEKDGFTSWFIGMPFFSDEFVPSVTLNDEWFAASTSKNFAVDLLKHASAGGEGRKGFYFNMDLKQLAKYSAEMHQVALNHEGLKGDLSELDLKKWNQITGALEGFDQATGHVRREDGITRSSFHLKTR